MRLRDFKNEYLNLINSKKKKNFLASIIFFILQLLSYLFLFGWWIKKVSYRTRMFKKLKLSCPVISIGNLTTGGTGKTPLVIKLATHFTNAGKRVAILTRGYGRSQKLSEIVWVSNGKEILATPAESGDEAVLIAKKVPQAAVVVGHNRYVVGKEVIQKFNPDLIILDDGFQRRFNLHRNLDILLIDALNPFSSGYVLPAGLLREPMQCLSEANVIILNKVDLISNAQDIKTIIESYNSRAYLMESVYRPVALKNVLTGEKIKPDDLDDHSVGVFSGIANPLSFIRTLEQFHILVQHAYHFKDHYTYSKEKLLEIVQDVKKHGVTHLITTEKDLVKIPLDENYGIPILVLEIELEIFKGKTRWENILKNIILMCSNS